MRQLIEWVQEMQVPSEFLSTLRAVPTPRKCTHSLRKGAWWFYRAAPPLWFRLCGAYRGWTRCSGAKVNGEIVPLRHALANGEVVESSRRRATPLARLAFVLQTSRARTKIRQWIHLHEREQATDVGKRLLEKEARQAGVSMKRISGRRTCSAWPLDRLLASGRSLCRSRLRKMVRAPGDRESYGPALCPQLSRKNRPSRFNIRSDAGDR